jgi:hypothetical protein
MVRQPHKHHDGPIDAPLCQSLIEKFRAMMQEMVVMDPPQPSDCPAMIVYDEETWMDCKHDWLHQMWYSVYRLQEVQQHVSGGGEITQGYHDNIIDICLSIQADYEDAKARAFTKARYSSKES